MDESCNLELRVLTRSNVNTDKLLTVRTVITVTKLVFTPACNWFFRFPAFPLLKFIATKSMFLVTIVSAWKITFKLLNL